METRTAGVQTDPKSAAGIAQSKKAELLSKSPALSEERLDQIAVYPKALYDAFLKGERFMAKGTVREAFAGCRKN